jgi:hypothetical protein
MMPVAIVLLAGLGLGCGEKEAPLFPSYETDVKPLMGARCIRCHGAGGTLNGDPDIPMTFGLGKMAKDGNFTGLEDVGMVHGLQYYTAAAPDKAGATRMRAFLKAPMPPPPAPPLTDREFEIINRWIDNPLP